MRRIPKLVLVCALAGASSFGSCEQERAEPTAYAPRIVEASPDLFAREVVEEVPVKTEQAIEDTPATPPPPRAPKAAKVPPAWLERALAEAREAELPLPKELPAPDLEPTEPSQPSSLPTSLPKAPITASPIEPAHVPPRTPPERGLTTATNVALAIGALGVGMGAAAAGSEDGSSAERVMAISWTGIGVASFATAGILYLVDKNSRKGVNVMAGPRMVGVSGSF